MSIFDSLLTQIDDLSNEIEKKLQNEDEECCAELLNKRQLVLENLADIIDKDDKEEFVKYQNFLRTIQARDNISRDNVIEQQKLLLSQSKQQSITNKAINAYNKFGD